MSIDSNLAELAKRWADASASERSNARLYRTELAEALAAERPERADAAADRHDRRCPTSGYA